MMTRSSAQYVGTDSTFPFFDKGDKQTTTVEGATAAFEQSFQRAGVTALAKQVQWANFAVETFRSWLLWP
jgi:hypothetical protein